MNSSLASTRHFLLISFVSPFISCVFYLLSFVSFPAMDYMGMVYSCWDWERKRIHHTEA